MPDAYRIGVRIAMADGVSAVLATLGKEFLGLDKSVKLTQDSVSRLRATIVGMGMVTVGGALLGAFKDLAEAGGKVVDQMARMRAIGVDAAETAKNMAESYQLAARVMSTTPAGAATMISELRSILENSAQARAVAPAALEFAAVLRSQNPGQGERASDNAMMAWFKGLDIQGAFVNRKTGQLDPSKAAEAFRMMEAASLLTHGLLTGQGFYQFTRMAGPAASLSQLRDYLTQSVEVMLGLGRTGGRGMQMAMKTLLGGHMTTAEVGELLALGAVAPGGIGGTKGHPFLKPGALVGYADLATRGVNYWFQHDLMPLVQKAEHGKGMAGLMETLEKSGAMNAKTADLVALMSSTGAFPVTAERLFSFLLMNQAQVAKFKAQFDKALGVDAGKVLADQSWTMNVQNLQDAWTGLMEAAGGPAAQAAIPVMRDTADALKTLTGWIGNNPWVGEGLSDFTGIFGTFLTVAGGTMIARGALGMLAKVLPLTAGAFADFAAGTEAGSALALLGTSLPEVAIGAVALAKAISMLFALFHHRTISATPTAGVSHGIMLHWTEVETPKPRGWANGAGLANGKPLYLGPSIPMPPVPPGYHWPAPLPLPPIPPKGGAPITISAPVHVTLPLPPLNTADVESFLAHAFYNLPPDVLRRLGQELAGQTAPAIAAAVQRVLADRGRQARRQTLQDPANAETVSLGSFAMGGL
ncbi:MAG TPA: hypothetical protein VMF62_13445 [Acetobacteraceae bacterium]|nr:hypothetical protein [Acetobacteraceae bacterium]